MKARSMTVGCVLGISMTLVFSAYLQAFSVSGIAVQSHRGMPFLAEIPLTLTQQERDGGVVVTLGDHEEYQAEGLERSEVIDRLEVSLITGARDVVLIASTVPIQEASFDLVLLVTSGQATIVRTYRVELSAPPPPTPPRRKPRRAEAMPPKPPASKDTSRTTALPSWLKRLPKRYGPVESGATLFGIVKSLGLPKETLWQALVLIWQANKTQFSGGNMHGLHSGSYLTIPPDLAKGMTTMSAEEAQRIVADQWEAWQEFRRAVSGRQHAAPAEQKAVVISEASAATARSGPETSVEEKSETDREKALASSTVVLPAESTTSTTGAVDMHSIMQGLEQLLAQRLPPAAASGGTATFVNATELQTALQGLEDRLSQQLQEAVRKVTVAQQAARLSQQSTMRKQSVLEQMLPPGSMLYVLVLENALLLFLAVVILWRWFRSRA